MKREARTLVKQGTEETGLASQAEVLEKSYSGWFRLRDMGQLGLVRSPEGAVPAHPEIEHAVNELCEKALGDARGQLHPLVQNSELSRLDQRVEFIRVLRNTLEQSLARMLAGWQPDVQAVFKYEEIPTQSVEHWDGSIHLLVKVPRLSDAVKMLGKVLDDALVNSLHRLGLPRFRGCQSVLDVQQITSSELRQGIGYGAMFSAVYTAPVKIWPQEEVGVR